MSISKNNSTRNENNTTQDKQTQQHGSIAKANQHNQIMLTIPRNPDIEAPQIKWPKQDNEAASKKNTTNKRKSTNPVTLSKQDRLTHCNKLNRKTENRTPQSQFQWLKKYIKEHTTGSTGIKKAYYTIEPT